MLGKRMKSRREALGMTQEQLAEKMGRKQSEVSRWERGAVPGIEKAVAIADALGVSVRWLITGEADSATDADAA